MKQPLNVSIDERGVCTLTMNRPERANAMDGDMVEHMLAALAQIRANPAIGLVILTGQGDLFCSGADLQWMEQMGMASYERNHADALQFARLLDELANLHVPTIARVNGPAYGGAIGLLCACDIAIASNTCRFTFSEVRLGLVPAVIAPYVIAAIGLRHARRWFLTARSMNATTAQHLGLVHVLVIADELDDAVEDEVQPLLMGGPRAQAELKRLLAQWLAFRPLSTQGTADLLARLRASSEGLSGMHAFLEKRKPRWLP